MGREMVDFLTIFKGLMASEPALIGHSDGIATGGGAFF